MRFKPLGKRALIKPIEREEQTASGIVRYSYRLAYELGATLDRVEGGKHFIPEDHPEELAAAINGLLEQTGARR